MQPYTSRASRAPGVAVHSAATLPSRTTGALTAPFPIFAFVRRVHATACCAPAVFLENVSASATLAGFRRFHTPVNSNRAGAVATSAGDSGVTV